MNEPAANHGAVSEGHVTSADGTRIGFLRQGDGPGLVLVQGAMGTAYSFTELAAALSSTYTVYSVDRRGRGLSPKPYDSAHDIARDVDDIDVVLEETGAASVFGLSSGAIITLEAARTLPRVTRAAVYEPPFYADGISREGVRRLDAEIERGDLPAALLTSLLTAGSAPRQLQLVPRPLARLLAAAVLSADARRPPPAPRLRDLLPGIRFDFNVVEGKDGAIGTFASVDKPVLLRSGTTSAAFLRQSVTTLAEILPRAHHVVIEGAGHSGPWNASQGGRPLLVAARLREFFV